MVLCVKLSVSSSLVDVCLSGDTRFFLAITKHLEGQKVLQKSVFESFIIEKSWNLVLSVLLELGTMF